MIFGRPTNLWLGLVTAGVAFAQVLTVTLRPDLDAKTVATVFGSFGALLAVVIVLIANQPPTVQPGGVVNIQTPAGEENRAITVR